jgi:DNA-binding GntR family transcriptional regulator
VYQLRKVIEVELAVSVMGKLSEADYRAAGQHRFLQRAGRQRRRPARAAPGGTGVPHLLADRCPNPLLRFMAVFLNDLLRDLVVLKKAYLPKRKQFAAANIDYHKQLLTARQRRTRGTQLMHEHMCDAEHHMTALEGQVARNFCWSSITPTDAPVKRRTPGRTRFVIATPANNKPRSYPCSVVLKAGLAHRCLR